MKLRAGRRPGGSAEALTPQPALLMPNATVGLLQGTLDLLVLRVLVAGPLHGYAISRRLAELSEDWLSVDEGSLYPCLYRMEKKGWISSEEGRSENNRRARFYSLTRPEPLNSKPSRKAGSDSSLPSVAY